MKKISILFLAVVCFFGMTSCGKKDVLSISASKQTLTPGENIEIETTLNDAATTGCSFVFVSGQRIASVEGNTLKVSSEATDGAEIALYATLNDVISNTLHFDVTKPSQTLVASISSQKIIPGGSATLSAKLNNADVSATFSFVGTCTFASITGNTVTVSEGAEISSLVQIVAKVGDVTSSPISFVVVEDANDTLSLSLSKDEITVDTTTTTPSSNQISFEIYNKAGEEVADLAQFNDKITVRNQDLVDYTVNNGVITFTPKKDGAADIAIDLKYDGNTVTELLTVKSIKLPDTISFPSLFNSAEYTVGRFEADGDLDAIKMVPEFTGSNYCEDYSVTFNSDKAHYDVTDKVLSFDQAGEYEVTITTDSGAEVEKSVKKTIKVNDGFNVRNYEEFHSLLNNPSTNDYENQTKIVVNVLNDLVLSKNLYNNAVKVYESCITAFGSFEINGNEFKLDTREVSLISLEERVAAAVKGIGALIEFKPYIHNVLQNGEYVPAEDIYKDFEIEINNLDIYGNFNSTTTLQDVLDMPGATDEACTDKIGSLTNEQKKSLLDCGYRNAIRITPEYSYEQVAETLVESGLKAKCNKFTLNNSYIDGFATSCIGMNDVVDTKMNNCTFKGSFGSTLDIKGGKTVISNTNFGPCGMLSVEYKARAINLGSYAALPAYDYAKIAYAANQNPADMVPYIVTNEQGLEFVNCEFGNWADGTSLNCKTNPSGNAYAIIGALYGPLGNCALVSNTTKVENTTNYFNFEIFASIDSYILSTKGREALQLLSGTNTEAATALAVYQALSINPIDIKITENSVSTLLEIPFAVATSDLTAVQADAFTGMESVGFAILNSSISCYIIVGTK